MFSVTRVDLTGIGNGLSTKSTFFDFLGDDCGESYHIMV